jgi:hypothetical protein
MFELVFRRPIKKCFFCMLNIRHYVHFQDAFLGRSSSLLKGQCHDTFDLRFFHESDSPQNLSIQLGRLKISKKFDVF